MWPKEYRDYKTDEPLVKYPVYPEKGNGKGGGKSIVGSEMHELNGWGNSLHVPVKNKKSGIFRFLIDAFFRK